MTYTYGLLPDTHDGRDLDLRDCATARHVTALPPSFDGGLFVSPVVNQLSLGSCTGEALAHGGREYLSNRAGRPYTSLSALWLYQQELLREHAFGYDGGARIRDGLRTLRNVGVPPESLWPYDPALFRTMPPDLHVQAHDHKITGYYRLHTLLDMHAALVAGAAVVMGIRVFESFESAGAAQTGEIPLPAEGERCVGGHALFVSGYNNGPGRERFKNSWDTTWGDGGFGTLPYAYFEPERRLVMDAWAFTA